MKLEESNIATEEESQEEEDDEELKKMKDQYEEMCTLMDCYRLTGKLKSNPNFFFCFLVSTCRYMHFDEKFQHIHIFFVFFVFVSAQMMGNNKSTELIEKYRQ